MRATIKNGKIHFCEEGWAMLKKVARKQHRSPKTVVHRALRAMIKREKDASL